ncbi:MAG: glycogen debranching enzyme family protein [Archangiaceae bacterium]|nr:glycogen debranching enzyme family protein [Archangiaceae bacterium]
MKAPAAARITEELHDAPVPSLAGAELPVIEWQRPKQGAAADALSEEWLVTNGLGGYASGTVAMCNTRKYHGLFVPSLAGFGRTVMLSRLEDSLVLPDRELPLTGDEHPGGELNLPALEFIERFTFRGLIPEWELSIGSVKLKKSIVFVHNESTLFVVYTHHGGPSARLRLRPYPTFRPHDVSPSDDPAHQSVQLLGDSIVVSVHDKAAPLRLEVHGTCERPFHAVQQRTRKLLYRVEQARGYPATEVLVSPGYFECVLEPGQSLAFCASLGSSEMHQHKPDEVLAWELERERKLLDRAGIKPGATVEARLTLAADQFIIAPKHRPPDSAWSHATGQDLRSVIAGYHWFTDWGRDTMISLEGLTLCTGRTREAAAILRTFQHHVRDGLVPNYFPEGDKNGVYHTADASLWFFHAVSKYLRHTGDTQLLKDLWPTLQQIVTKHLEGTYFGIGVDPTDGLLKQGQGGYQLTWMDAKVDDWVVTPRRGKAVEINALWFNALKLMEGWAPTVGADPALYTLHARREHEAFNARFWNEREGCLFDVVDGERGDDASIRPNQLFAISLTHPVLAQERWNAVMGVVRRELLTPVGLRTLSPKAPDFKATYDGDLRARDAAYHQGTVWPWLLGHYVDAVLKTSNNDTGEAMEVLSGLVEHLQHTGLGSISEIFDAVPPYQARGCIAQAWSVAETLRVWREVAALGTRR